MKKFHRTKAFWRGATGFLMGIVFDFIVLAFVMHSKAFDFVASFFEQLVLPLWYPVWGLAYMFTSLFDLFPWESLFGEEDENLVIVMMLNITLLILIHLFHPLFWASIFYCVGKRQNFKIVIGEIVLTGIYTFLFLVGMFNLS